MKDVYLNLVEFWNKGFWISEEDKNEITKSINPDVDYKSLAPSQKQYDAIASFKGCRNVLDYGCGSGWASIIMAKNGVSHIDAVDVAKNAKLMVEAYCEGFKVNDKISAFAIDKDWLARQERNKYDGLFCSNVIDVIPLDMAKEIVEEASRVVKEGSKVIFSLNYYIDPVLMKNRGAEVNGSLVFIDGVLRLNSMTDEEWISIFKMYFKDLKIDYYAWPNEAKETRRLFTLIK